MAILRKDNRKKFTVVNNSAIRDDRISLKALGLLVRLLSLPDDWEFSEEGLVKIFKKDGQASIRSGIKELELSGYLVRNRKRDEFGRLVSVEWIVYEYPQLENPSLDTPNLDNRPQLNTKETKHEETKNLNIYSDEEKAKNRFVKPTLDEVSEYCRERNNGVDAKCFVDFYESKGWLVGKSKMKDWKAAVRTWERKSQRSDNWSNYKSNNGTKSVNELEEVTGTIKDKYSDNNFELFWNAYPNKYSKGKAKIAWEAINPDEKLAKRIIEIAGRVSTAEQYSGEKSTYIPSPENWLKDEHWEDGFLQPPKTVSYELTNIGGDSVEENAMRDKIIVRRTVK